MSKRMIDAQLQENVTLTPEQYEFLMRKSRKYYWSLHIPWFASMFISLYMGSIAAMHTFRGEAVAVYLGIALVSAILCVILSVPYLRMLNGQQVFERFSPALYNSLWLERHAVDLDDFDTRTGDIPAKYVSWLRARDEEANKS